MRTIHFCSLAILLSAAACTTAQICNIHCDGHDPAEGRNAREAASEVLLGRQIRLYISDEDNMGFGEISSGNPRDEIWIERTFNGGITWEGGLGHTTIPSDREEVSSRMYNVDNPSEHGVGGLRVCGKPYNRVEIACTVWARSTVNAERRIDAGATALMMYYNGKLFSRTGWWNGANCLTALLDYFKVTGSQNYTYVIDEIFENNKDEAYGNFTNEYIDDVGWWGWHGSTHMT